ncbi:ABC transporter permease [Sinorhizobium terangae]|uniref:ABC transporter permease n=1 Tax=Sinorhizobium terangae TaxID=110322 RepID=UPI0024B07C77|nr:ABC transporter permease [Sinorhizobium terangae]WFU51746.1 ABC transporter permease [Sinorhizobium terangae]
MTTFAVMVSRATDHTTRGFFKFVRSLISTPSGSLGVTLVGVHLLAAFFGGLLASHDPIRQDSTQILTAPGFDHIFGTDQMGRDVFSRTLVGGRIAMAMTGVSAILAVGWGAVAGIAAAMRGGIVDAVLMRLVEAVGALPYLLFLLLLASISSAGVYALIPALALFYGTAVVRVARAATHAVVSSDFVAAARVRGETSRQILLREILPNVLDVIVVDGALRWSSMLLGFSSLSFLGFGVSPPTPDWGLMVSDARNVLSVAPWAALCPCVALASLILGFNFLADAVAKSIGIDRCLAI